VSIGDTLAEARRQAGLTVTLVSQQTRIRESIINSIEHDDFSSCGGDFYARGHIRSIATVVGVDPAPLIREYDQENGPPGRLRAAEVFEPATPIKIREPRPFGLGKVMVVLLLAVIGFAVYRLVSSQGPHPAAASTGTHSPSASSSTSVRSRCCGPSRTCLPRSSRCSAPLSTSLSTRCGSSARRRRTSS